MWPVRNGKFSIGGGRGGFLKYNDTDRKALLEWEMKVSRDFDIAIYGDSCRWTAPDERQMTKCEVRTLVREFVNESSFRVELVFGADGESLLPLNEKKCSWVDCQNLQVKGVTYCIDHLFQTGARR